MVILAEPRGMYRIAIGDNNLDQNGPVENLRRRLCRWINVAEEPITIDLYERAKLYLETVIYENMSKSDANLETISEEIKNLDFTIPGCRPEPAPTTESTPQIPHKIRSRNIPLTGTNI